MSSILSQLEKLEESILDNLYYKSLLPKEKLQLEEKMNCSITQIKSRVEGYVTDIKRKKYRVVVGTGILSGRNVRGKFPYAAVIYEPELLMEKRKELKRAVKLTMTYLTGKASDVIPVLGVPLRVLEEVNIANVLGKRAMWIGFKDIYIISEDLAIVYGFSGSGITIQAYFPRKERKKGIASLVNIAKKFESYLGLNSTSR